LDKVAGVLRTLLGSNNNSIHLLRPNNWSNSARKNVPTIWPSRGIPALLRLSNNNNTRAPGSGRKVVGGLHAAQRRLSLA
jgi:hypothetical protein